LLGFVNDKETKRWATRSKTTEKEVPIAPTRTMPEDFKAPARLTKMARLIQPAT
jgi:hypothetical protein